MEISILSLSLIGEIRNSDTGEQTPVVPPLKGTSMGLLLALTYPVDQE